MPKKDKGAKKTPTVILDNISLAIEAKFGIVQITMKNDWQWRIKMRINEILPKTHHDYSIKLKFDPTPYEDSIDHLSKQRDDLDKHPTLHKSLDAKDMKRLSERMEEVKGEMEQMRADCFDIDFVTQTEEIKYAGTDTYLVFKVLDSVIDPLNTQKFRLSKYIAILEPIIK